MFFITGLLTITGTLTGNLTEGQTQGQAAVHRGYTAAEIAALAGAESTAPSFELPAGQEATLAFPAPFSAAAVGLWWKGELGLAELAIPSAGSDALDFYPVVESADLAPQAAGATGPAGDSRVASLVHASSGAGRGAVLRLRGPLSLRELSVVWIETAAAPDQPELLPPPAAGRAYPKPPVYSRASWGADPPQCSSGYCNTTHVGIHHSASASEFNSTSWSQCANNVKATQAYHMYTRGWCDIGYNYLVCVHGDLWEGRAGGDNVIGAHDGYNCGSMGVCMMGYFHTPYNQVPSAAMLDALAELGAWKCDQQGIDPLGSGWYAGYGANMSKVYGHRDVSATACPGDLGYAELPGLRLDIQAKINGGGGNEIILDNDQAITTGSWTVGTSAPDKYGTSYLWASTGTSLRYAYWQPSISQSANYQIYFWWPQGANRNPSTKLGLRLNGQLYATTANQQINGGRWNYLGTTWLSAGANLQIGLSNEGPAGYVVVADAIRLVKQ